MNLCLVVVTVPPRTTSPRVQGDGSTWRIGDPKRNCEHSVSQKNCELHVLQADTKETAKLDSASHKKNCLN